MPLAADLVHILHAGVHVFRGDVPAAEGVDEATEGAQQRLALDRRVKKDGTAVVRAALRQAVKLLQRRGDFRLHLEDRHQHVFDIRPRLPRLGKGGELHRLRPCHQVIDEEAGMGPLAIGFSPGKGGKPIQFPLGEPHGE